ncbi:MAG TPA: hypothetical protein VJK48_03965 [Chlamydiales bacterium]|nr:hypothetical protein [Chlamydiales bacterium]
MRLNRGVFLFFVFLFEAIYSGEPVSIEGVLLGAELKCYMVAPERRIEVKMNPQMFLLPDSIVHLSGRYLPFLWIKTCENYQKLVTKHVRVEGVAEEFLSGEFLVQPARIIECEPTQRQLEAEKGLTEEEMCYWEEQIPLMASAAFQQVRWRALLQGFDVMESRDDALWLVHPDGTETFIKELPPRVLVEKGRVLQLKD